MKNSPNITVRLAKSQFARAAILEKDLHPHFRGTQRDDRGAGDLGLKSRESEGGGFRRSPFGQFLKRIGFFEKLYADHTSAVLNAPVPVNRKSER
jgi:hypothetical protein